MRGYPAVLVTVLLLGLFAPGLPATIVPRGSAYTSPVGDGGPACTRIGGGGPSYTQGTNGVFELVGHLGGSNHGMHVQGTYAFTAFGPEFAVVDIANPAAPVRVGYLMMSHPAADLFVVGNYAYVVGQGGGLRVIDVANPADPHQVGFYDLPGMGVHVVANYAYVVDANQGFVVLDVSDPANPQEVGSSPTMGWRVFVSGDYAYVAGGYNRPFYVLNVSDPANPYQEGSLAGSAAAVYVVGNYAYVTDSSSTRPASLRVIDVSDPADPQEAGSEEVFLGLLGEAYDVHVVGDYAYIAGAAFIGPGFYGGIEVVDVSDPANPDEVGNYVHPEIRVTSDVYASGDDAFLAGESDGMRIIDLSDPAHPTESSAFRVLEASSDVLVAGNYAYVGDEGIKVVDVSDPADPFVVGYYEAPPPLMGADRLALAGDYAYTADTAGGFRVIDVSDPADPTLKGSCDCGGSNLDVADTYAYLAWGSLKVVDTSNPNNPHQVASYVPPKVDATDVDVAGGYAYVAAGEDGLRIVEITDPLSPTEYSLFDPPGSFAGVQVSGDYAYVADAQNGLRVINIADPQYPYQPGSSYAPGGAWPAEIVYVHVSAPYAYISDYDGNLWVVDVSDPADLSEVASYTAASMVNAVYVSGELIYVVDGLGGLSIFQLGEASLEVAPAAIPFLAEAGGAAPPPRLLRVESTGGSLAWTASLSPTVGWLEVTPLSGGTPACITVTAEISGLVAAEYETDLVIESGAGVQDSPQIVPVRLVVADELVDLFLPVVLRY